MSLFTSTKERNTVDDGNEWTTDGRNILSPERLAALRDVLEHAGPVIVEHWFYYGGCSPDFAETRTRSQTVSTQTPKGVCQSEEHI